MSQSGNSFRIRIFLFIAFVSMAGVLYYSYRVMQTNVKSLVTTVRESAFPDQNLVRLKLIWSGVQGAENDVRSFTLTGDDRYLVKYHSGKDTLRAVMDSLIELQWPGFNGNDRVRELDSLVEYKWSLYDSLLEISYAKVLQSAMPDDGKSITGLTDTAVMSAPQGTLLQRMFSSRYSRKAIQARADSLVQERSRLLNEYDRNVKKVRLEEARQFSELKARELSLIANDRLVTSQIERLIKDLEGLEQYRIREKANASELLAEEAASGIRALVTAGLVVVLALFMLVLFDVEASNRRRKELAKARAEAEKLARAKEEFMSTMSHEIRTPLTSVIGFAGKLAGTSLTDEQQRYSKAISGSSEHLLAVVNDVLDLTRVESGKLRLEQVPFQVRDIFWEVFEALRWKAEEKELSLMLETDQLTGVQLNGDPVRLRQVLFNLAGNAIKFTDTGHVSISGRIFHEQGKPVLEIQVEDTGIGIPEEKIESIFDEYVQADDSTSRKYGGSGLGLAITRRIVEQQGGNIFVKSKPNSGSVFTVTIPYLESRLTTQQAQPVATVNEPILRGMVIILAEDDDMIRELQVHTLSDLGAEVLVSVNGLEAVRLLEQNDASLILMDIRMPEMGGPEAVRVIRTGFGPPKRDIPVIGMTANEIQQDEKEEWLRDGMNDFISKPFRQEELVQKIQKVLRDKPLSQLAETPQVKVPPQTEPPADKLYDLTELRKSSNNNPEFVRKMTGLFMSTAFASLNNLHFYAKQQNLEQLERTAHRMIGSYKQMGVALGAEKLKQLERIAASGGDADKISGLVADIDRISRMVFDALKKENP